MAASRSDVAEDVDVFEEVSASVVLFETVLAGAGLLGADSLTSRWGRGRRDFALLNLFPGLLESCDDMVELLCSEIIQMYFLPDSLDVGMYVLGCPQNNWKNNIFRSEYRRRYYFPSPVFPVIPC